MTRPPVPESNDLWVCPKCGQRWSVRAGSGHRIPNIAPGVHGICDGDPVKHHYVLAEGTDEMVERAAQRLISNFSFFDPSDNNDAWRAARLVLAAAFSTQQEPQT